MENCTALLAFGTFGNPNGFKQTVFIGSRPELQHLKSFDLNTNAIKPFPKSCIYAIRKENIVNSIAISYSIYHYAKEPNSDRSGTFIGSSIVFIDNVADENLIIAKLNEAQEYLLEKNLKEQILIVDHSDKLYVNKPKDWEKLDFNTKDINLKTNLTTNTKLVIYCEVTPSKLLNLFKESLSLLELYDTIYFTGSKEVAEYVHAKNIFKLIEEANFKDEIKNLKDIKQEHKLKIIEKLNLEIENIKSEKKKDLTEIRNKLKSQEKILEDCQKKINALQNNFKNTSKAYSEVEYNLKVIISNVTFDSDSQNITQEVLKLYSEFNKKKVIPIEEENNEKEQKIDAETLNIQKNFNPILIFVNIILAVGVLYLYFNPIKHNINKGTVSIIQTTKDSILVPNPNNYLDEKQLLVLSKNIDSNMTSKDVVREIFKTYPDSIQKVYLFQASSYEDYIIKNNSKNFVTNDSNFVIINSLLHTVPFYVK